MGKVAAEGGRMGWRREPRPSGPAIREDAMTKIKLDGLETYARRAAGGVTGKVAAPAAGRGAGWSIANIERLARREDFQARVEAIRRDLPWTEGRDPGVLLAALERACQASLAAGKFEAATRIVAEAARLRKDRPAGRGRGGVNGDFDFDAWAAKYGPKS
jgi:hypothetical protein